MDTHLSYQRGNTLMWGVTLRTNFNDLRQNHLDEPHPVYTAGKAPIDSSHVDWPVMAGQFESNAGWNKASLYSDKATVTLLGQQQKYRDQQEAIDRTALVAINHLPETVDELRVIELQRDLQLQETVIDLDSVRKANQPQILGQETVAVDHQKYQILFRDSSLPI